MDYICYVHIAGSMTPHVHFMGGVEQGDLGNHLQGILREWPAYQRVEIYDGTNSLFWAHEPANPRVNRAH